MPEVVRDTVSVDRERESADTVSAAKSDAVVVNDVVDSPRENVESPIATAAAAAAAAAVALITTTTSTTQKSDVAARRRVLDALKELVAE